MEDLQVDSLTKPEQLPKICRFYELPLRWTSANYFRGLPPTSPRALCFQGGLLTAKPEADKRDCS